MTIEYNYRPLSITIQMVSQIVSYSHNLASHMDGTVYGHLFLSFLLYTLLLL